MLGLKRGEVMVVDHQTEWDEIAAVTIKKLKEIFGDTALDIQHIGSTAIHHIKAKPMIDIAVGVTGFDTLADIFPKLEEIGVYRSSTQPLEGIILCAIKENRESNIVLCNLHIVIIDSMQWQNHINFRDYMNAFPQKAHNYEKLKIKLAEQFPNDRDAYTNEKKEFIEDYFYIQYVDSIPYKLKARFDFSFLSKYGKVFKVFDDQDSGNICFGLENDDCKRYFVKFAGAPTDRACVTADEAIRNLKRTVPIYKNLENPSLIRFISSEEIGGAFAMVFEWVDAECMHMMYPLSRQKFMQMTITTKLQVFDDILAFFNHVVQQGYVAIDFYDGSIMYDFHAGRTIICDVDLFEKSPYTNNMGRMWGSSRFMSSEEFTLGATIDEITNVYTLGATAFALFGDERDRCFEKWSLSKEQFYVAKKAVSDERCNRQQSIKQLIDEWRTAKSDTKYESN